MIEYYSPHKKILLKTIASLLVVSFVWYDIARAADLFYATYPKPAAAPTEKIVTNYDLLSGDNRTKIGVQKLLPSTREKEQDQRHGMITCSCRADRLVRCPMHVVVTDSHRRINMLISMDDCVCQAEYGSWICERPQ